MLLLLTWPLWALPTMLALDLLSCLWCVTVPSPPLLSSSPLLAAKRAVFLVRAQSFVFAPLAQPGGILRDESKACVPLPWLCCRFAGALAQEFATFDHREHPDFQRLLSRRPWRVERIQGPASWSAIWSSRVCFGPSASTKDRGGQW